MYQNVVFKNYKNRIEINMDSKDIIIIIQIYQIIFYFI